MQKAKRKRDYEMIINCKCSMCGGNESTVVGFDSYALALRCEYCGSDYSTTDKSLIDCFRIKWNKERKEREAREVEERKAREAKEAEEKIRREEAERTRRIREAEEYASYVKDNNNKISKSIVKSKIRKGLLIPRIIIYALALTLFGLISLAVTETAPIIITIVTLALFIISIVKVTKISHRITNLRRDYI